MKTKQINNIPEHDTITAQDIIDAIPHDTDKKDRDVIEKACLFALKKHAGQKRYSGLPYYTHTFEVGKLLAEYDMQLNVIVAGILHDTIEDTDTTKEEITKEFNKEIAFFVESVSHLGDVRYHGLDIRIKSLQKLFVATAKDPRVIIIKIMDRLHNMRTIDAVPKKKQSRIVKETQLVYAPLADRLGMSMVKTELENLAFKNMQPKIYATLRKKIEEVAGSVSIQGIGRKVSSILTSEGITNISTKARIKSVYSTHLKMQFKKYSFKQVRDIIALRVLIDDIPTAYTVLGIIHSHWRPIPETFKDYIAAPKPNGYRALHTFVIIDGKQLEIHIMTYDMYQQAQFGIAAHFNYKEKRTGIVGIDLRGFEKLLSINRTKKDVPWLDRISSMHHENDEEHFVRDIQADFLQRRMFVFTPKGDVVDLPIKATALDFAFAIHSTLGLYAEGVYVNGKYASLKQELKNGDIVNIKKQKKPNVTAKWLEWLKTAEARARVRQFIKKNS